MALRFELLKSLAVATCLLLHMLGCSPLPAASVVALSVIQSMSVLGCALDFRTAPSKHTAKLSSAEVDVVSMRMGQLAALVRAHGNLITEKASVKIMAWSMLAKILPCFLMAIIFAKALHAVRFDTSPLAVLFLASSLGALCQLAAAALGLPAQSYEGQLCQRASGKFGSFWPSLVQGGNGWDQMISESPLEILAKDAFATPMTMESPLFDLAVASQATPPKHTARSSSQGNAGPCVGMEHTPARFSAQVQGLTDKASVGVMAWSLLALILAKALRTARPDGTPLEMMLLVGSLGALCQLAAAALRRLTFVDAASVQPCEDKTPKRDLEEVFARRSGHMPGAVDREDAMCGSPLASMAEDIFAIPVAMQAPFFEVEA